MAGASMKSIKTRIRSMESTKQITKAMEMVATSKLRRAQERVQHSRPYFEVLYEAFNQIAAGTPDFSSPFMRQQGSGKVCYIVIAGDRGLAGGYNNNVFRMVQEHAADKSFCVVPIGKKAGEYFRARGAEIVTGELGVAEDVSVADCFSLSRLLAKQYREGAFDAIYIAYTNFVSILNQSPCVMKMLPLDPPAKQTGARMLTLYEPGPAAVFDAIVPEYLGGLVYGALCESSASEQGARRTAMDSASKNAGELIDSLTTQYNRIRQGAITQEITEIVAGSES